MQRQVKFSAKSVVSQKANAFENIPASSHLKTTLGVHFFKEKFERIFAY
jgi:hypothetical protein